jgi:hypothetical protein
LVPSNVFSINGVFAELPVRPVVETLTSRVLASSIDLIGLVCQTAQALYCVLMEPIHSNLVGSYLVAPLPSSGSVKSVLNVEPSTVPSRGAML